jgi:DNA polymerase-3 subunit gamma/tau
MAHKVISLKHRPQNFDELTGQSHVVLALKGAIKSNTIGHAFLFAGPRGVGKTTTARVFAKSVNCVEGPTVTPCQKCQACVEITTGRSIDVVEIDGASNRKIDDIRDLREGVRYAPLHCRYKIYIIDEVHALTDDAFDALLKTLEEPPANVIFILATTNPTEVPATILSRCQRFTFKRLSLNELTQRLSAVAQKENIKIDRDALRYLAVRADGSVRDGESILEQLASFVEGTITKDDIFKFVGFLGSDYYRDLLGKIIARDLTAVLMGLNKGIEDGGDPLEIYRELVGYLRNLLLHKAGLREEYLELSPDELALLDRIPVSRENLIDMIEYCLRSENTIRRSVNPRVAMELLLSQLVIQGSIRTPSSNPGSGQGVQDLLVVKDSTPDAAPLTVDIRQGMLDALAKKSPRLAGTLTKAEISREGKVVVIKADTEFSKKELQQSQKTLLEIVKKLAGADVELSIRREDAAQKEIDTMAQKIKTMFDGEEVR